MTDIKQFISHISSFIYVKRPRFPTEGVLRCARIPCGYLVGVCSYATY